VCHKECEEVLLGLCDYFIRNVKRPWDAVNVLGQRGWFSVKLENDSMPQSHILKNSGIRYSS
jgi:hypothetical protein